MCANTTDESCPSHGAFRRGGAPHRPPRPHDTALPVTPHAIQAQPHAAAPAHMHGAHTPATHCRRRDGRHSQSLPPLWPQLTQVRMMRQPGLHCKVNAHKFTNTSIQNILICNGTSLGLLQLQKARRDEVENLLCYVQHSLGRDTAVTHPSEKL